MKKEEKTKRSYEKIVQAAIEEFGKKGYDKASLTTMCNENHIPKGLLYHNFKGKDDLFLVCLKRSLDELIKYTNQYDYKGVDAKESMGLLLHRRHKFFKEKELYGAILFNILLNPPISLKKEIREIRKEFDEMTRDAYRNILSEIELREDISMDMAIEYLLISQDMFNGYFQSKTHDEKDISTLIENHEINVRKLLDIMLYGIAKRNEEVDKEMGGIE